MTTDLAILAHHASYITSDNDIISDSTGLSIANIGSFTLTSLPLLHVSAMSINLISESIRYADILINVLLFYSFFQVQDRHMWVTLVRRQDRDSVYYWSRSVPLQPSAFLLCSSVRSSLSTISMWHSLLGHLSLRIFCKFLGALNIFFLEEHLCSFSCTSYNINKSHKLPVSKSSITPSSPLNVIFSDV